MVNQMINKLSDLLDFQENLDENKFFCFRGQSFVDWNLVPSIYRGLEHLKPTVDKVSDGVWLGEMERDVYREFDRSCMRFNNPNWDVTNPWHRLFLAQHYEVPTRLLDWSRNLLVATYFAVKDNPNEDGAIWWLNVTDFPFPTELGRLAVNRGYRIEALDNCIERSNLSFFTPQSKSVNIVQGPKASPIPSNQSGLSNNKGFMVMLEPPVLEDRIKNQSGLFSLYISNDPCELVWDQKNYIETVENHHGRQLMGKIAIQGSAKLSLQKSLEKNGIDPYHIFPDLAGLVMLLKRQRNEYFSFYSEERSIGAENKHG